MKGECKHGAKLEQTCILCEQEKKASPVSEGLSCKTKRKEYILEIIDRDTGKIIQTETRKSEQAFDRLWSKAISNVNSLKYKLKAR